MWRFILVGLVIVGVVLVGFGLADTSSGTEVTASAVLVDADTDDTGYTRALQPLDWQFPHDFGPHPDYQTEWWYYTGNLADAEGRRFGYQFTVFRRAITPVTHDSDSEWRTGQMYVAHFTVSDIASDTFYHEERYSRGGAGLAGATADPAYRVWLEDWQVVALNDEATQTQITAASQEVSLELTLEQVKSPALQGDGGLSPKGEEPGNASHYYSLSRLSTQGTLMIGDETFDVTGVTWKDHEFSTSALTENALGWDWFGLIFDDERELMIGQIRLLDGDKEPLFGGLLIEPDGSTQYLDSDDFTIQPLATWASPHTGAAYPAGWDIQVATATGEMIDFTVMPLMADQELHGGGIAYWEGAVEISGDVAGYGYAELTGYADTMTGRF